MGAITTLATPFVIVAIVNYAKRLSLPGALAPLLSILLGIALQVAQTIADGQPLTAATYVTGFLLGMGASGLYDVTAKPESRADEGKPDELDKQVTINVHSPDEAPPPESIRAARHAAF